MALYYCEHCTAFCENKGKKKGRFNCSKFTQRVQTNADKIRSMTDEEIAEWYWWMLRYVQGYTDSRLALSEWLKEEVGE